VVGKVEVGCVGDGTRGLSLVDEGDHEGKVDDVVVGTVTVGGEGGFATSGVLSPVHDDTGTCFDMLDLGEAQGNENET